MISYGAEDRIDALRTELQQLSEDMELIDQEFHGKDPESYESNLEYWGDSNLKGIAEINITKPDHEVIGTAKLSWLPDIYTFC